jgi:hypothetical protein
MRSSAFAILCTAALAACQPESLSRPEAEEPRTDAAAATAGTVYGIDARQTDIRILVFRAGPLARLGHNHVISAGEVDGTVIVHTPLERSVFELRIPADSLRVDDPAQRREEGADFSTEPTDADVAGTTRNLLGERVLDSARYPTVTVAGRLTTTGDSPSARVSIRVKGRSTERAVPVALVLDEHRLRVRGTFELSHEELGLAPFSALLGALQVAENLTLKFDVTALAPE